MLIVLESVGSVFDTKLGIIYPQTEDGGYDKEFSISVKDGEVSYDWWESLSSEDLEVVNVYEESIELSPFFQSSFQSEKTILKQLNIL